MRFRNITRILLLPFGLVVKLFELSIIGSRDIDNKLRFRGSVIDKNCCIDKNTKIEAVCHILENNLIVNSSIRRCSYIGRNSIIQNVTIGSFCSIASDVFIGLGLHPIELFSTSPVFYRIANIFNLKLIDKNYDFSEYKEIVIGHDVWIGARAIVLDGVNIGDGAVIATNAVVTKNVPPYAIVAGIPAKVIRYRFPQEKIDELIKSQWWLLSLSEIQKRMNESGWK